MSTNYNYTTDDGLITTANNDYTFYDPTNASSIYISESIDAAAASLQVGVDKFETQFIEIGSSDITTTIYGAVNMTHALNVSSLSVNNGFSVAGQTTLANVSVNNLTVTGVTTLANASVTGTLYVGNQTRLISETTGMTIKPDRTDSLSGNLELKTTHGSYNVPNGQGTSITDGGFTFRSTNANGTAGNNLLRIQNITTGVFTYPLVPSGTNLKNNFTPYPGVVGSITQSSTDPEEKIYTYSNAYGQILTNVIITAGISYRFTFTVKFSNTISGLWFYNGSVDQNLPIVGTEYKTYSYIFTALTTFNPHFGVSFNTPGGTIYYKHFSLEPIYETTVNDLGVTGALKTNTIISTAALKINETNGVETAINSGTSIANNLTLGSVGYTTQYIRGVTVNINEYGSGNTVIGTSGGTGTITVNRPLTIGYPTPPLGSTQALLSASLSIIGGSYFSLSSFAFTLTDTLTAFAPINNMPAGRYMFTVYVFLGAKPVVASVQLYLVVSNLAIVNNQTTGITQLFNGVELYTQSQVTNNQSINTTFIWDVGASPNNNFAIALIAGVSLTGANLYRLTATRIA
jgi:hypothetical protein